MEGGNKVLFIHVYAYVHPPTFLSCKLALSLSPAHTHTHSILYVNKVNGPDDPVIGCHTHTHTRAFIGDGVTISLLLLLLLSPGSKGHRDSP